MVQILQRAPTRDPRYSGEPARPHRARSALGLPWVLPALVLTVGVVYYGIGYTADISRLKWDGMAADPPSVGVANYTRAFDDPVFWKSIQHTILFFVVTFCCQVVIGMFFAVILHSRVRLSVVYRVILFVPVVLAPSIMAPVFREMFGVDGAFNWVLEHVGLGSYAQPWLAQSSTALICVMAINIWEWSGLAFVLYFAGMSQIDPEMLEAARIDGAGNFKVITAIIFPSLRATTITLMMLDAIKSLKTFDIPYLVVGGGPNNATEFLGTMIFRQSITNANVGYGAALSILLLILAVGVGIALQLRSNRAR